MFSSAENNSYPALSSYHLSPSFTIPESNNILLNQSQSILYESPNHLPFLNSYLISENSVIMPHSSTTNSTLEAPITQENTLNCPLLSCGKKPSTKKDRHTKISTAQGLRDRRVRLSINIAREFFNLQDLLGFDKTSKTLGWLLSKSKAAIDELASSSSNNKNGVSPASQGDVVAQDVNEDEDEKQVLGAGKPSTKKKRERKGGEDHGNAESVEREMRRAKARERARERTNKKKMIMVGGDHNNHLVSHHQRAHQNLMIHQPWSEAAPQNNTSCLGIICTQQGMISVGETSKSKSSSSYNNNGDQILSLGLDDEEGNFYNHYNNDYLMKLALKSSNGGSTALLDSQI